MLGNQEAIATVAVRDIGAARQFYEDRLGLTPVQSGSDQAITYRTGGSSLLVYASQFAGTNQATTVTWIIGGKFDEIVQSLRAQGISFEHYDDLPGLVRDGDVHRAGDLKLAWFKDPDGNIHHLNSM